MLIFFWLLSESEIFFRNYYLWFTFITSEMLFSCAHEKKMNKKLNFYLVVQK